MGIFTPQKEQVYQTFFREDMTFVTRKVDVEDGWKIELNEKKKAIRAFMLPYKLQRQFDGYKNVPPCNMTIDFSRDILLDPFSQLKDTEKPEKGKTKSGDVLKKDMMRKIADAKCHKLEQDAKPTSVQDKIVLFMGIVSLILALAIGLKIAVNRTAKPVSMFPPAPAVTIYQEKHNWTI